jgi:hypothetical protein
MDEGSSGLTKKKKRKKLMVFFGLAATHEFYLDVVHCGLGLKKGSFLGYLYVSVGGFTVTG